MTNKAFTRYLEEMQNKTVETLKNKAKEYATCDDRLHNFRVAAKLQDITEKQALGGMMAKHIVSVYDMIGSLDVFPRDLWEEKIKDSINYLFLLWAMVCESSEG